MPISARPMTAIERVKDMGVWIIHGELDTGAPVSGALDMQQVLDDINVDVRFTIFPEVGHGAVTPAIETDEIRNWLLVKER